MRCGTSQLVRTRGTRRVRTSLVLGCTRSTDRVVTSVRYAFTVYQIISSVTTRTCLVVRTLRLIDTSSTSGTGRGGKAIVWITIKSVQKISIEARTARRRIHSVLKRHTRTTLSVLSSFTAMLKAYVARQIMTSVAAQTVRI